MRPSTSSGVSLPREHRVATVDVSVQCRGHRRVLEVPRRQQCGHHVSLNPLKKHPNEPFLFLRGNVFLFSKTAAVAVSHVSCTAQECTIVADVKCKLDFKIVKNQC